MASESSVVTDADLNRQVLESNRVIVRIWTSYINQRTLGESVGHGSIQTPNMYASVWPKQAHHPFEQSAKEVEGRAIINKITHEFLPGFQTDLEYEGREPEVTYCFYSLDYLAIEREFDEVKKSLGGWCALGLCKDGESCVSLVYRLLQSGGIDKLAGGKTAQAADESSTAARGAGLGMFNKKAAGSAAGGYVIRQQYEAAREAAAAARSASYYSVEMGAGLIVKSPDFLAEILEKAKQRELEKHPDTKSIKFDKETPVSVPENTEDRETCCVM